jgi:hypothetical protein
MLPERRTGATLGDMQLRSDLLNAGTGQSYLDNDFHFLDQTPTSTRPRPPAGCRGYAPDLVDKEINRISFCSLSRIRCDKYHNGQTCLWSLRSIRATPSCALTT